MANKSMSWGDVEELKVKLSAIREIEGRAKNHCDELYSRSGHKRRLELVKSILEKRVPGCDFFDIGCAEGLYCGIAFEAEAKSVVGVDISITKIKKAIHRFPACKFYCKDASNLKGFTGQFDIALCSEVLQHIPDYKEMATSVFNCVRRGGIAIFTVPNLSTSLEHEPAAISSKMDIKDLLANIGGAGFGKQNALWKFNSEKLYDELVCWCNAELLEKIPVDTPDGQVKNLWTIGVFQR